VLQFVCNEMGASTSRVVLRYVNRPTGSRLLMTLVQNSSHCTARTLCRGSRSTSFLPDAPQSAFDCKQKCFKKGKCQRKFKFTIKYANMGLSIGIAEA
jgi:hypothetical protein